MTEEVETELKELEKTVEDDKNSLQEDITEIIQSVSVKANELLNFKIFSGILSQKKSKPNMSMNWSNTTIT